MANTITNTTLVLGSSKVVIYFTLVSDGSQETSTVVYNSSTEATAAGFVDPKKCRIREIHSTCTGVPTVRLDFAATTPVAAWTIPRNDCHMCFDDIGGLKNTGGTGRTGNITITTTGLISGDSISFVLVVGPEWQS